jgi:hypothetical protein
VKGLLKNGVPGRNPAVRGYWKLSFPENEVAVKGNFPAGAFMAILPYVPYATTFPYGFTKGKSTCV